MWTGSKSQYLCMHFLLQVPDECPEFRPIGCYEDRSRSKNPALGSLLITDRDGTSKVSSGKEIDWLNYGPYIHE